MFQIPKTISEDEYRREWENGSHQSEYNACRFANDKIAFAKDWLLKHTLCKNVDDPKDLVDRICWCKLYDLDERKPKWVDKISAHTNLYEIGLPELAIEPIFFSRGWMTDSDWKSLPDGKFIMKMAHGSGWNIKFTKTKWMNPEYLQKKIYEWYNLNFAYIAGWEWQYDKVKPGFLIEPDLGDLMNWEFWCENGKILGVNLKRKISKNIIQNVVWCDEFGDAGKFDDGLTIRYYLTKNEKEILNKMKPCVFKLAQDFKFVRVDLYWINNQIKFSELTFTPHSGDIRLRSYV